LSRITAGLVLYIRLFLFGFVQSVACLEIGGLQWKIRLIVIDLLAFIVEKVRLGLMYFNRFEGGRLYNLIS
jgi:hypothetical protein